MISTVVVAVIGATLSASAWWLLTKSPPVPETGKRAAEAAPSVPSSSVPSVGLQVRFEFMRPLPIPVGPRGQVLIVKFKDDYASDSMNFVNERDKSDEWPQGIQQRREAGRTPPKVWPPEMASQVFLANHEDKALFNVLIDFPIEFQKQGDGGRLEKVANRKLTMGFDAIRPASEATAYFVNQSRLTVTIQTPSSITAEIQGISGRRSIQVRMRPFNIIDQLPGVLMPTRHEWRGDVLVKPYIK